jgi:hypothetical protein
VRPLKPEAWRRVPREQHLAWGQAVLSQPAKAVF